MTGISGAKDQTVLRLRNAADLRTCVVPCVNRSWSSRAIIARLFGVRTTERTGLKCVNINFVDT